MEIKGLRELPRKLDSMANENDQRRRIAAARCPVHGRNPTDIRRTVTSWGYRVCCERLGTEAAAAMMGL